MRCGVHGIASFWQREGTSLHLSTSPGTSPATLLTDLGCAGYCNSPSGPALGQPSRGDVLPADLDRLSLPAVDPIPIATLSPRAAALLKRTRSLEVPYEP